MRRVLVAAIALVVALSCAAAARPAAVFVLKGHGWGHGIGLAQYGARGYADAGRDYRWILDHYYPGTTLATRNASRKVLLASGRSSLSLGSIAAFRAQGVVKPFASGTWTVTVSRGGRLKLVKGSAVRRVANNTTFVPGGAPLALSGRRYRGTITLRRSGRKLWALNTLRLDAYVRGVVAREMPSSWHLEALKAQSVAARSYSLSGPGKCSWFGSKVLCPDTWDQVYGGVGAETPSTNAAVAETANEVLLSGSTVAATFFFSSSGGKTASVSDEWGSPQSSYPYLVSVEDPHDVISPHHNWGSTDAEDDCFNAGRDCVWPAGALKRALGSRAPRRISDFKVIARNGSSRVVRVALSGAGDVRTLTGSELRARLRLRSTWFSIGVLRLTGGGSITKGKARTLRALARNMPSAKLQRKVGAGAWTDVREIRGSVTLSVRPRATTFYRLRSPAAATSAVRVTVPSQPRFAATQTAGALTGVAAPGEAVQAQRLEPDGDWVTVAVGLAGENGVWRAAFEVAPGTYRAYVASGGVVGTSPELTVVAG